MLKSLMSNFLKIGEFICKQLKTKKMKKLKFAFYMSKGVFNMTDAKRIKNLLYSIKLFISQFIRFYLNYEQENAFLDDARH